MRILCHSDGYLPDVIGGIEVFATHLYGELARRGHEILVVTSRMNGQPEGFYEYEGIRLCKLAFETMLMPSALSGMAAVQRRVHEVAAEFRPHVIHENDAKPSGFFFLRRGAFGEVPRLLTLHTEVQAHKEAGLKRRLMAEADHIATVSQFVNDSAIAVFPELSDKLVCIPNALKPPTLSVQPPPFDPPVFLCMGRIVHDKAMDVAVEALALLEDKTVRLKIAGNGPMRPELERLVAERGLADRVTILGWLMPDSIPDAINSATGVLTPSRWQEPFGLVALQAAMMGRPAIASRVGGLPEIVRDNETGFLVPPDDPAAMAAAMNSLLQDRENALRMGSAARTRAEKQFCFSDFASRYEAALQSAIEARGRRA